MPYDAEAMRRRMEQAAEEARLALEGRHSDAYKELRGLSPEEIDSITPGTTDQEQYEVLLAVVQEATRQNLEQAELVARIRELGGVALAIARKVPSLAAIL